MMKCEFEKLIGHEIAENSYSIIEYVYTWHPSIDEIDGKKQIVEIYKIGGMCIIRDMYNTAKEAEKMHDVIMRLNSLRDKVIEARNGLLDGTPSEIDIDEIRRNLLSI